MIITTQAVLFAVGVLATPVAPAAAAKTADSMPARVVRTSVARIDTGAAVVVDLSKMKGLSGNLSSRLKAEAVRAKELGRTPVVEFSANQCGGCRLLEAAFQHPRLRNVMRDMYVIRIDVDLWRGQVSGNYSQMAQLPLLVALGLDGTPTGQAWSGAGMVLEGDPSVMRPEYDDAYIDQVALGLKQFFASAQRDFFRALLG